MNPARGRELSLLTAVKPFRASRYTAQETKKGSTDKRICI
jgi:hypothetical protein